MLLWIKSLGQDFQRGLIANLILVVGLGGITLARLKVIGGFAYDLANNQTNISLTLLLCALFYLLGKFNEKTKWSGNTEIKENSLIEIGPLKWNFTIYKDNSFDLSPLPYCHKHETKLVEQNFSYVCPIHNGCHSIDYTDLTFLQQQAESLMEAGLRKKST